MWGFVIALQFLTRLIINPNIEVTEKGLGKSIAFFPIIGCVLGCILIVANLFLSRILFLSPLTVNLLIVIILIWLTGGLHLDGLADTIDGLSGAKEKEKILSIMRDSYVGVMGVLSLICLLGMKVCFLGEIQPEFKNQALLLMPLMGRWGIVIACCLGPYARDEGKAKAFVTQVGVKELLLATIFTIVVTIALIGWKGMSLTFLIPFFVLILTRYLIAKINGITGDTLGACCECSEVLVLIGMIALGKLL
ncbi:cobalamin 5'-phosphate synthase [Candidatus Desantisbacteria bacterium CG2_30_40_21]|uniref:Adenosylcobinamide-GDP ribazoletransferase n=5 Tax=unclassified Candidatus Desantisiibacteriota TaxID=3106372 RepID=A0A2M7J883_9BACT|nr:MAG: cobalamin 5'-phosphate synthase [Candidatus Desantisbacteria bacterium CG2_30_40_21]PIP40725.1 MAG: adenosylcobinamide-GDP ribazoletransferase [Candidatus Desantisbacteria bacterium CG23_combo_of_CG06-09_8_20_14_all_40_23]PIX15618.1 MAG: adenosylcobinamide-GDP ribazoletransferase [Candidatus Desantisbacteria bacterium CG_4_8_14_3_um_filter_40_12]PIY19125.1 MAG: adenosylcobinamide-GDP ribazoletransferase [Candidatus Desantisbacteria bacterium CG_4_10_14_3_um_filter_40_18]PJB30019.1 MAG: 